MGCLPIPSLQSTISSAELLLQKIPKMSTALNIQGEKKKKSKTS